jgi:tetratricopeptide (TPR) repeat protein
LLPPQALAPAQPLSATALLDLGLTCAAMGQTEAAIDALRHATKLQPNLAAAWRKLGQLSSLAADKEGARAALAALGDTQTTTPDRSAAPRAPTPAKLQAAERQLRDRFRAASPDMAELLLREHLRAEPRDAAALCLLAEMSFDQGNYHIAERLLERAVELAPFSRSAQQSHARVLFRMDRAGEAVPILQRLLARQPNDAGARVLLASSLATIGRYSQAIEQFEAVIAAHARNLPLLHSYARALRHAGRRADSERVFRKCLDIAPGLGEAYFGLVNVISGKLPDADLAAMRASLARGGQPPEQAWYLNYALGQALEQAADYAASFAHYAAGARLRRANIAYSADENTAQVQRTAAFFSPAFFQQREGWGCPDASPIFIVGLPRSGSTLVEQILASHSAVEGTRELPEMPHIAFALGCGEGPAESRYWRGLAALDAVDAAALGARYIERAQCYRTTAKPFFVDKLPDNWTRVGLIRLILPNAKIIDARRNPMASCFSAFKQCFVGGQDFSYDLRELGRYYTDYVNLMAHWDAVFPGRIHRVIYEDMVADTETEIRRLLAYCALPFEPACLRFWENPRGVSTISAEQVRRPIYREGVDQWRHYEPWLGPLKESLQWDG